jgi:hypothetical protein
MGHNRAGDNVKARKRQHRREERRLAKVAALQEQQQQEPPAEGLASKAKHLAQDVVGAVGGLMRKMVDKVTGKGSDQPH